MKRQQKKSGREAMKYKSCGGVGETMREKLITLGWSNQFNNADEIK
jgi:hypothetical protein